MVCGESVHVRVSRPLHHLYAVPMQNLLGSETLQSYLEILVVLKRYGKLSLAGVDELSRDALDLPFTRGHSTDSGGQPAGAVLGETDVGVVCNGR